MAWQKPSGQPFFQFLWDACETIDTNNIVSSDAQVSSEGLYSLFALPAKPQFTSFDEMSANSIVPDCAGAVSSSNIVSFIKFGFRVNTKSGVLITNLNFFQFWGSGLGPVTFIYDPVIVFDAKEMMKGEIDGAIILPRWSIRQTTGTFGPSVNLRRRISAQI